MFWDPLHKAYLGGGQVVSSLLFKKFTEFGIECIIASFGQKPQTIPLPQELIRLSYSTHNLNLLSGILANSLRRYISLTDPDVIYVMSPLLVNALLNAVRRLPKQKRPITVMDMGALETDLSGFRKSLPLLQYGFLLGIHKYYYDLLSKFDFINSCSVTNKVFLIKYLGIPRERIFTISTNVVPDDWFLLNCKFTRSEELTMFSPGRVERVKGYPVLLEAVRLLVHKFGYNNIKIAIINNGKYLRKAIRFMKKYSLTKNFIVIERLKYNELRKLYLSSMIVPVLYMHANVYSQVLCEGMATGNIVIASDIGAFREIIRDGENGFLIKPDAPNLVAKRIHEIISNSVDREKIQREAVVTAYENCRLSHQATLLINKLKELL